MVTKERYGSLKAIFAYFTELVRESEKMGTAYVDTAVELTEAQKQAVKNKLLATTSYQTFDVYYHVDGGQQYPDQTGRYEETIIKYSAGMTG